MSTNTLTTYTPDQIKNPMLLAEHFAKSGYFKDTADISKALVKIVAGQELGFGPMAAITGFHIIQGKPTLSANLMASAIKRSGKYNFRVKELTNEICNIDFLENGEVCGNSVFTIEDAKKAGTQNLQKFPKNMLYARALSNGARWYCPDVLNGSPIYTPEELGANVNEDGDVIESPATAVSYITDSQLKLLLKDLLPKVAQLKDDTVENLQKMICDNFKVGGLMQLTTNQASQLIQSTENRIKELEDLEVEKEAREFSPEQVFDLEAEPVTA